jgi:hypothetical protein
VARGALGCDRRADENRRPGLSRTATRSGKRSHHCVNGVVVNITVVSVAEQKLVLKSNSDFLTGGEWQLEKQEGEQGGSLKPVETLQGRGRTRCQS